VLLAALMVSVLRSGPPEIDAPELSATDAQTCRDFVDSLPATLAGEKQVETTGDTAYGAAWGDPAIVLTCGVGKADLKDIPPCAEVDGVGWLVPPDELEGDRDATFTADGYRPRIRLDVPDDYLPEGGASALADLAAPVKKYLKKVERCL
jgi:Protein of unknown function (DUF3515)